jgi:diaminohydroxyphosphoribosylaminopyrimidine deaminase/5-amino-6-(5-phosphoribosylamino)uracil reductase
LSNSNLPPSQAPSGGSTSEDHSWMRRALSLAKRGEGWVEPNPMVGCVLVREGRVVGEGFHHRFGDHHAEVEAIHSLADPSHSLGATAYVTLEPCCHFGKTPPCCNALIAAGVRRVVIAMTDPFPKVAGGGVTQLQAAGIEVSTGTDAKLAQELNAPYLKRLSKARPWVIGKWAMTMDGKIATASGDSQWISGELSRGEVHRLRGRMDAVIVGGGTVAADDPTLTSRPPGPRTPLRIAFVRNRLPNVDSKLLRSLPEGPVCLVVGPTAARSGLAVESGLARQSALARQSELADLERRGVELFRCDTDEPSAMVIQLLEELGRRSMTNVLVEGGASLLSSFVMADELDEIHAYIAPKVVGGQGSPGPVGGVGFVKIADSRQFRRVETTILDDDVRLVSRRIR